MQRLDRLPVGDIEYDTHHRGLRAAMQAEDMVITAGAAKILRVVAPLDGRQPPHRLVKTRRLIEIGGDKLDAAQAANEARRHRRHPLPSSFFTIAPALEKSIRPEKRSFSAAMVRPMSLSVAASSSLISEEIAEAASISDMRLGR